MHFDLKSAFLSFLKPNKWNFQGRKWRVALDATELQQKCHRTPQPTKHAQLTKFCPFVPYENVSSKCAHMCEFLPGNGCSKRNGIKNGQWARWQASLRAQFPKVIGEVWQWFEMGIRWRWSGNIAVDQKRSKSGGGWDCFREGCAIP